MSREEFSKKIETLYQSYFERTISDDKEGHPQLENYTNCALITMQDDNLQSEIKRVNKYFNKIKLSEYQQAEYEKALIYQLHYVLTEGDFSNMSGYDMVTNTFTSMKELSRRVLAPRAKTILTNAGLMYRAIGGSDGYWERRRRF